MNLETNIRYIIHYSQRLFFIGLKLFNVSIDAERTKALKDGENLLLSGHVRNVEMHKISPNLKYCFVRAVVNPAMSRTNDPYKVWLILHKETSKIEAAYCECPAG